jgi:putative tricarboxylic transport membrane protein
MINDEAFWGAIVLLSADPMAWLVVPPGIIIGLIFGSVPGLSISIAMAVFLPATLYMDFLPAILFLTAIFTGGGFGGAIPAILMNIPGTSAAVATAFDGYPMSQQGKHGEALGIGLIASVVGTFIGYAFLIVIVDSVADLVLRLGPTEMLVIATWGLLLITILNDSTFAKGLAAGALGLLVSTVGYSNTGMMRGTFDSFYLLDGIPAIPALIGLFAPTCARCACPRSCGVLFTPCVNRWRSCAAVPSARLSALFPVWVPVWRILHLMPLPVAKRLSGSGRVSRWVS